MSSWEQLTKSQRSFLVAPAGCGKTHLIAQAVANLQSGHELILTHTHAGVDAIRRKLRQLAADPAMVHIDTIAGWSLRYASSYPVLSGLPTVAPLGSEWDSIYNSAQRLIRHPWMRDILRASYSGVYVDEYQDCTIEQHELIVAMAEVLPCRILGDPLQGIFSFRNNVLVDWEKDVASAFDRIPDLSTPWRWVGKSPKLGCWLMQVRQAIQNGAPIDVRSAPKPFVQWVELPASKEEQFKTQLKACRSVPRDAESVVAIHSWEAQCNRLAICLAPMYGNIETIECADLMKHADAIDAARGLDRAEAVVSFAVECITAVRKELGTALTTLRAPKSTGRRPLKRQSELDLLVDVQKASGLGPVLPALEGIRGMSGTKLWRKELYYAMLQSLREFTTGEHQSLKDAAWAVRNRTRHAGRRMARKTIGRTLLVKGLEFDHCIVLNADSLKEKDLYVALTRGACSLTILSRKPVLQPRSLK